MIMLVQQTLSFEVGKRYRTRGGAVVRVLALGPNPDWRYVNVQFEKLNDGSAPNGTYKVSLCPGGEYWLKGPHELDLVSEAADGP